LGELFVIVIGKPKIVRLLDYETNPHRLPDVRLSIMTETLE
jgi:hypothetical protein